MTQSRPSNSKGSKDSFSDEAALRTVATTCLGILLSDDAWRLFGFKKRPRYGAWVNRFRPAWKVELEDAITQGMLAETIAAHLVSGRVSQSETQRLTAWIVSDMAIVTSLGFGSREQAVLQLMESITAFADAPLRGGWSQMLLDSVKRIAIPDKKGLGLLTIGCVKFEEWMINLVLHLRTGQVTRELP
jgi:hypothetical protein